MTSKNKRKNLLSVPLSVIAPEPGRVIVFWKTFIAGLPDLKIAIYYFV
jgi:hypothetical protein